MKTTQTSPNGGGWEWGLKNPTQTKIFIKLYTMCLKEPDPWKDFSNKGKITLQIL